MVKMSDSTERSLPGRRPAAAGAILCLVLLVAMPAHAGRKVTIKGGGWGHGIGMSQYGAYGRAKNGKSAENILEKYYTGAEVKSAKMPRRIRVGLLQGRSSIATTSSAFSDGGGKVTWKVSGSSEQIAQGGAGANWKVEAGPTGAMRLLKNGDRVRHDGRRAFGSSTSPLILKYEPFGTLVEVVEKNNNYAYGRMEFASYSSSSCGSYCLNLVVKLPMQKYLYGLGEVPASWPSGVLRAQAIAGRTYAYEKVKRLGQDRYPCACAVYDSTIDQAYIGDAKRTGSGTYWTDWKGAVDATGGQVILYRGDPIQALYSSSSGGHTENNENVWGGAAIPYLRGVADGPDAVSANPNHEWSLTMTWRSFSSKLAARFGTGKVSRFRLLEPFGVSGRVTVVKSATEGGVKIVGDAKTVRADGWDIRSALGLKDTLFRVKVTRTD
jgi:stage II sporulation protein D